MIFQLFSFVIEINISKRRSALDYIEYGHCEEIGEARVHRELKRYVYTTHSSCR
jgi:hypothetical protein